MVGNQHAAECITVQKRGVTVATTGMQRSICARPHWAQIAHAHAQADEQGSRQRTRLVHHRRGVHLDGRHLTPGRAAVPEQVQYAQAWTQAAQQNKSVALARRAAPSQLQRLAGGSGEAPGRAARVPTGIGVARARAQADQQQTGVQRFAGRRTATAEAPHQCCRDRQKRDQREPHAPQQVQVAHIRAQADQQGQECRAF